MGERQGRMGISMYGVGCKDLTVGAVYRQSVHDVEKA